MRREARGIVVPALLLFAACGPNRSTREDVTSAPPNNVGAPAAGAWKGAAGAGVRAPMDGSGAKFPAEAGANADVAGGAPRAGARTRTVGSLLGSTLGQWIESSSYRLRIDAMRTCGSDAEAPTQVGFQVRMEARGRPIFVSPRDLTFESEGTVLEVADSKSRVAPPCSPILRAETLRPNQKVRGFVIFEIPRRLMSSNPPYTLAYRPTRWGGAGRVEVRIDQCLACAGSGPQASPQEKRTAPSSR